MIIRGAGDVDLNAAQGDYLGAAGRGPWPLEQHA